MSVSGRGEDLSLSSAPMDINKDYRTGPLPPKLEGEFGSGFGRILKDV